MNEMMKRILSLVLCVVMVLGVMPVSAFATDGTGETAAVVETTEAVVETTEAVVETTEAVTETTQPIVETTEPIVETTEKIVEETEANTEETEPNEPENTEETAPEETPVRKPVLMGMMVGKKEAAGEVTDNGNPNATIVVAGSDYQYEASSDIMQSIMSRIQKTYSTVEGILMGGDYDAGEMTSTGAHIEAVDDDIDEVFPGIASDNRIYLQGNHETWSNLYPGSDNLLTTTGEHDTDYYGVYAINHDDYPWYMSNPTASQVKETAEDLDEYLDDKVEKGYDKPVFVMSHLPLHYSTRTSKNGDCKYAKYIYDVLDEAGDKGLNIIFLFGHNHSNTYDDYLGGGQIYLEKGDTITIAGEGETSLSKAYEDTLSFTYMNYGYLGYIDGKAGTELSMTVFEITDDQVVVKRYGEDSVVQLKAAGVTTSGAPAADTSIVESGATITLTTPTVPSEPDPSVPSEPEVSQPVEDETGKVSVTAPGIESVTVTKAENPEYDTNTYSAYASYDITLDEGYVQGTEATVTIRLDEADGFVDGAALVLDVEKNVNIDAVIANGAVTFKTNHFSEYDVMQTAMTDLVWNEVPGGIVYQLDTDGLTPDTKYLIVNTGTDGPGVALRNAGGTEGVTKVTISGGKIILEADTDVAWVPDNATKGSFKNQEEYLRVSTSGYSDLVTGSKSSVNISSEGNGAYKLYAEGWGTYYIAYNNDSWDSVTTESKVYLYECKGVGNGGYVAMTGKTDYNVTTNTTTEEALKTQIQNNLTVYTATNTQGTDAEETNDYTLVGTVDPTKAGTYTYTVNYSGVELGRITVSVVDKEIENVALVNNSGSVVKGASSSAATGAKIKITYKDGTFAEVDVTLKMLTKNGAAVSTAEITTIDGITVTYGNKTWQNFTLNVTARTGNNYPEYPHEGAVKVDKTATGIKFQSTGIAQVEISASGVPMNQGVDVVIILDTSSSMDDEDILPGTTRIEVLRKAVDSLIGQLKTPRPDGTAPDIDIAIADFNGYIGKTYQHNGSTRFGPDNFLSENGGAKDTTRYGTGGWLTDPNGDGWVEIQDLPNDWGTANGNNGNIKISSGTNYDHGLQQAYDLLSQKKAADGNDRKQFVIFMSDGAPFQYNGFFSYGDSTDEYAEENANDNLWTKWLMGYFTPEELAGLKTDPYAGFNGKVTNPEFYNYDPNRVGQGQSHRIADAIKGEGNAYQIVKYNADGSYNWDENAAGLGATMYSIGFALKDDPGGIRAEEQRAVLATMASDASKFFNVTSEQELYGAFTSFGDDVLMAAYDARFVDQMGPNFNLQMTPFVDLDKNPVLGEDGNQMKPKIEILSYDIYTKAEADAVPEGTAGDTVTNSMIGDRKGTKTVLETVTFSADGKEAFSDKIGGGTQNILSDGVIHANTFWYNTKSTPVTITGVDIPTGADPNTKLTTGSTTSLPAETFYWKLGTIQTTELAMRYYVYLEGSMDGKRPAGSYATNTFATLFYDNYLENPCFKETTSPTVAWKGANVSYAFYLVNDQGEIVVNQTTGQTGSFANKVAVTQPVVYSEILLNNSGTVQSLAVESLDVLPDGYKLYDNTAKYTIEIDSDSTGSWLIEQNAAKVPSTYVTGFNPSNAAAYSKELSSVDSADYTHTTVWFAVVWIPAAIPDAVVIDYGLPVDISVLGNDQFGEQGTLNGINLGKTITGENLYADTSAGFGNSIPFVGDIPEGMNARGLAYGSAEVIGSKVRYTPRTVGMESYDRFYYEVKYPFTSIDEDGVSTTADRYYQGDVTVIPATTIYYEDSFLTLNNGTSTSGWITTPDTQSDAIQAEDRPGKYSLPEVDANNIYGYDGAYTECSTYSLDSAAKVHLEDRQYAFTEFTFYGTGFDVISLTSNETGNLVVQVYEGAEVNAEKKVRDVLVSTYYGMLADGTISNNTPNTLYQVPVIKIEGLSYKQYTAVITASYTAFMDKTNDPGYDLYLDAIRIYDPAGNTYDKKDEEGNVTTEGNIDKVIQDAYIADGEGWPSYTELRNHIISKKTFDSLNKEDDVNGAVFIDAVDATASIEDYISYGPNNELYLAKGQAIAFSLGLYNEQDPTAWNNIADVQIGLKLGNGDSVSYKIYDAEITNANDANEVTLTTATDMYYSIKDHAARTTVIKNTSDTDAILSITNIKITYKAEPVNPGVRLSMTKASTEVALMSLQKLPAVEPEVTEPNESIPEVTETVAPETETTVPEITEEENTEPEETEPEETKPESSQSKLEQALANAAKQAAKVAQNMKKAAEQAAKALSKIFSRWF